jgi:Predicted redox protein, regulator of disulfide bond formation
MSTVVKSALEQTIQNLKNDPSNSKAIFEARAVLGKNVSVTVGVRQFEFKFDEPQMLGGADQDPNPVEYVLASLGACQAIVYRALASLKGIQLHDVTVNTKGHLDLNGFLGLDKDARPGFSKVEFETTIVSDEPAETIEKLAAQVESLCPVLDIIANPVLVTGNVIVKKKENATALVS